MEGQVPGRVAQEGAGRGPHHREDQPRPTAIRVLCGTLDSFFLTSHVQPGS